MTLQEDKHKLNSSFSEAIAMIGYEGQLIWAVNAFLVAAFLAINHFMPDAIWGVKLLPILGLIISVIWSLITLRMFDYYGYWFAWARHCEQILYDESDQVISKGKSFSEGNEVIFGKQKVRLSWYARLFKNKHLMLSVISIFAFLYAYLTYMTW